MDVKDFSLEAFEKIDPVCTVNHNGKAIHYSTPTTFTKWRVDSLFAKEPDTIAWIKEFERNEIFLDIGANMGIYTIWATLTQKVKTFSFEPESTNYALLNKNIYINEISDRVTAFCAALSDVTKFDKLHLSGYKIGSSCHSFGEKVNFKLEPLNSPFSQGCFSITIDELVNSCIIDVPQHIKIDVDGFEHKVIHGAEQTLHRPELKSLLVELNTNLTEHTELRDFITAQGFKLDHDLLNANIRTEGAFTGVGNHIFRR